MSRAPRLILVRHGESAWNRDDRFTGWADVDLTDEGVAQMRDAAVALREAGIEIDLACSSVLRRCIRSQWLLLEGMNCIWVPQRLDWRLNERHYGALTGRLKAEAVAQFGEAAVLRWRRSFEAVPPPMDAAAAAYVATDRRYAGLAVHDIPVGESLQQTVARVRDAWQETISVALRSGSHVAVTAHGNSLRALIKIVEGLTDHAIAGIEVANGEPIVYELDAELKPQGKRVFHVSPRRPSEIL